ncbi:MAG: TRAP transporter small permease [Paracoccaceae bacterium]
MRKAYATILKAEGVIAGMLLFVMVTAIFAGGVTRMMAMPQNWTIDVASCAFAWACFLCADIAWRRDALMSIDFLPARLPPRGRQALGLLNLALITGFLGYLIWTGLELSWTSRARSFQGIPSISYSLVTLSLPVGSLLLLVTTVLKIRDLLRDGPGEAAMPTPRGRAG